MQVLFVDCFLCVNVYLIFLEILYGMPKFNFAKHYQKKGIYVKMDVNKIQTNRIDKNKEPI